MSIGNYHGKFESSNLSRDNVSREIRRSPSVRKQRRAQQRCPPRLRLVGATQSKDTQDDGPSPPYLSQRSPKQAQGDKSGNSYFKGTIMFSHILGKEEKRREKETG